MAEHTLEAAILALSSVDQDHASVQNGIGFNGTDTGFGNSLAKQIVKGATLSPKQQWAAYKMLAKYKVQLSRDFGLDYGQIAEPSGDLAPKKDRTIDFDDGVFIIKFPYDQGLVEDFKNNIPGRKWTGSQWVAPEAARDHLAKFAVKYGMTPTQTALAKFEEVVKEVQFNDERIESSRALDSDYEVPGLGMTLYPFQRAGVKYAVENIQPGKGIYFGDEMGLGKTPESLATLHMLDLNKKKPWPVFVVVPPKVWMKWAKEINIWLKGTRKVCLLAGTTATKKTRNIAARYNASVCTIGEKLPKADIYIVSWPNVHKWVTPTTKLVGGSKGGKKRRVVSGGKGPLFNIKWGGWIYDEAHALKTPTSKRSMAVQAFAEQSKAPWRIMASGTPVPNRPREILPAIVILGRLPDVAKNEWDFLIRFCAGQQTNFGWDFDGATNGIELNNRMRAAFFVQRDKKDALPELPPVQLDFVDTEITNVRAYNAVHSDWKIARTEYAKALRALEWAQQTGKDVKKWQDVAKAAGHKVGVSMQLALQTLGDGKIQYAINWLESFLEDTDDGAGGGAKILVFGIHRSVNEAIAKWFSDPNHPIPLIYGGTNAADQDALEERFQTDPKMRVLVAHPESGGVGINLTAATHVAFVELPFRPMDFDQAIARAYGRMNDIHGVNAYIFMYPSDPLDDDSTADEHVWDDIVAPKSTIIQQFVSGKKDSKGA